MSTAVLATTGQRGSFLSLIDCTLIKICLKEILSFPCSFPLLLVLPFWQMLPHIRSRVLGEPAQGESSLQNAARAATKPLDVLAGCWTPGCNFSASPAG